MIEKVSVPEGAKGQWRIERFSINEDEARAQSMKAKFRDGREAMLPGQYTRLMRGRQLVMSDTPDEMRDHLQFVRLARGRVLINGLGLGRAD